MAQNSDTLTESDSGILDSADESQQVTDEEDLKLIDETIKNISRNLRKGDWTYLGRHPEIRAIVRVIVTEAVKKKPSNIFKFAADLFDVSKKKMLTKMINQQLKWVNSQTRKGTWSHADGATMFTQNSSSDIENVTCAKASSAHLADIYVVENNCPETFKPSCPKNVDQNC